MTFEITEVMLSDLEDLEEDNCLNLGCCALPTNMTTLTTDDLRCPNPVFV